MNNLLNSSYNQKPSFGMALIKNPNINCLGSKVVEELEKATSCLERMAKNVDIFVDPCKNSSGSDNLSITVAPCLKNPMSLMSRLKRALLPKITEQTCCIKSKYFNKNHIEIVADKAKNKFDCLLIL